MLVKKKVKVFLSHRYGFKTRWVQKFFSREKSNFSISLCFCIFDLFSLWLWAQSGVEILKHRYEFETRQVQICFDKTSKFSVFWMSSIHPQNFKVSSFETCALGQRWSGRSGFILPRYHFSTLTKNEIPGNLSKGWRVTFQLTKLKYFNGFSAIKEPTSGACHSNMSDLWIFLHTLVVSNSPHTCGIKYSHIELPLKTFYSCRLCGRPSSL